jgi:hypothetical protein
MVSRGRREGTFLGRKVPSPDPSFPRTLILGCGRQAARSPQGLRRKFRVSAEQLGGGSPLQKFLKRGLGRNFFLSKKFLPSSSP